MGIGVMIMGQSGSGKSASLRNFKSNEIGVINVAGKPLPFKSDIKSINTDDYKVVKKAIAQSKANVIVIDDSQFLMADEFMKRTSETGYQKFTDIGFHFWDLVNFIKSVEDDKIVYFLHHTDLNDSGREKAKTIGKMLDEKITLESMFTIVLKTEVDDSGYYFRTKTNGMDTVKSPIGMFEDELIDNDLKLVDQKIRSYYGLNKEAKKNAETK